MSVLGFPKTTQGQVLGNPLLKRFHLGQPHCPKSGASFSLPVSIGEVRSNDDIEQSRTIRSGKSCFCQQRHS